MALLVETEEMIFNNLHFFSKEKSARSQTIKREIDMLMPRHPQNWSTAQKYCDKQSYKK